jgi:hypothetical protein
MGAGRTAAGGSVLARQPALIEAPETVLDLLYQEVVLRQARGEGRGQESSPAALANALLACAQRIVT